MIRIKDILSEEETQKVQNLKIELLNAHNEKERKMVLQEINDIFETAKKRYYALFDNDEQAVSLNKEVTFG